MKRRSSLGAAVLLLCASCAKDDACGDYQAIAADSHRSAEIARLVREQAKAGLLDEKHVVRSSSVRIPGRFSVALTNELRGALPPHAEERVILNLKKQPVAVFIGSRNMVGIFVDFADDPKSPMIPSIHGAANSSGITAVCVARD